MEQQEKTKKRPGPAPSGKALKNRTFRMDDVRWSFYIKNLGIEWFRALIDKEIAKKGKS